MGDGNGVYYIGPLFQTILTAYLFYAAITKKNKEGEMIMQTEKSIQEIFETFMQSRKDAAPHCVTPVREGMFRDAMLGVVVGDAVGVPFECGWRDQYTVDDMVGYEPWMPGYHETIIPIGTWSDDSALTFATLDSYHACGKWDSADLLKRFCDWLYDDAYVPAGQTRFGEGKVTVCALENFRAGVPADECGVADETRLGNGSLMRILPLAFYPHTTADIARVSAVTHAAKNCVMACVCYVEIAERLIAGADKFDAVHAQEWPQSEAFGRMAAIETLPRDEIKSSGHVIETLEASLWCFLTTDNYRDCILKAVNLGRDTDTIAAIAGGLAGMYYQGEDGIPKAWIKNLQTGYEKYTALKGRE